jgi:predicted alpha/beta superfamily hydrolase
MRKLLFCLLLPYLFDTASAQYENKVVIGTIDSIDSRVLNEQRKIWVYVPKSSTQDDFAKVKYPVVYLLDGDTHFNSVVGIIQQLSSINNNSALPEMIVVGILNVDRTRDLTPTHADFDPMMVDTAEMRNSGGGEKFISFIEKELMPYVDSTYPTLPYRTIIGHSFGGLTVINTLINHKNLFNAYAAIDPSMWWDKKHLLAKARDVLAKENYRGKTLFLAIANTMIEGMDTTSAERDTSLRTQMIRSILSLNALLKQNKNNGLSYNYKYYKNEDHASVPLIATYDALHFIFKFYDLKLEPLPFMNVSMGSIAKLERHFEQVSKVFGFTYHIPEKMVNHYGYWAISQKKMTEAEYLFQMNVNNYPTSFNVYDSMGDFYVEKGDKRKAAENYQKALTIKESADTRTKLNSLSIK